jgi:Fe-S cluster assembly protein SufD
MTTETVTPFSTIAFTDAGFESFLSGRGEPDWLTAQRRAAWETFGQLGWPQQRGEEWGRTDIRLFHLDKYSLGITPSRPVAASLTQGVELGGQTTCSNGRVDSDECLDELKAQGVLFGSLDRLIVEHAERIRPHFSRAFDLTYDRFAALHAAFWTGGTLLYVPRGVVVRQPLHMLSVLADHATDLGRTLVVLEDGAEATLLSEQRSPDPSATGLHCGAVELLVGRGANLRYVGLQDWGQGVWHFSHQKAVLERDASLQWTSGALGSRLAKVNQHVALVGPGASSQVNGVMFTENQQHLSYQTLQHHRAPQCTSDFLYKAALQDRSRTVWRGMIKVDPGAQKTDGYQRNDNLMLSATARADSIPGLEIEADDVRCTHGSTSGRVDEELIFYSRSRGFTRKEAIQLIVAGFFQQVFDRITIPSVRDALSATIASRVRAVGP